MHDLMLSVRLSFQCHGSLCNSIFFFFFCHVLCNSCIWGCEDSLHVEASKFLTKTKNKTKQKKTCICFVLQGDNAEEELLPQEVDGQFEFQAKDNLPPGGFKFC